MIWRQDCYYSGMREELFNFSGKVSTIFCTSKERCKIWLDVLVGRWCESSIWSSTIQSNRKLKFYWDFIHKINLVNKFNIILTTPTKTNPRHTQKEIKNCWWYGKYWLSLLCFFIRSFSYRILHFFIYKNKLCKQNQVEVGKKE